jgi:hypothetical protein
MSDSTLFENLQRPILTALGLENYPVCALTLSMTPMEVKADVSLHFIAYPDGKLAARNPLITSPAE